MKTRTVILIFVPVLILVSVMILLFTKNKNAFYDELEMTVNTIIEAHQASANQAVFARDVDVSQIPAGYFQAIIQSPDGIRLETRYYIDRSLVCIRYFGKNAKLVRADYFFQGIMRARNFYDDDEEIVFKKFFDETGAMVDSHSIFVPFYKGGGIY